MSVVTSSESVDFIREKTPEKLRAACLVLQVTNGYKYTFREIQFVNGFWYAWYERPMTKEVRRIKKDALKNG